VPVVPANTPDDAGSERDLPRRQRVAAYAVVLRGAEVLLSRLAPYLVPDEQWTLPGGGIEFGEDPRDAVVREVYEETGLRVTVGDRAWIDSAGREDYHAVRIVFEGWAPKDAPVPRVVEVEGSTVDARWVPLADVFDGVHPVVAWVRRALEEHAVSRVQRLSAKALVRQGDRILLARLSGAAVESGRWTLPGGGVDHGETPAAALVREMYEETGLAAEVGDLLGVHDLHFTGTSPTGRNEDFHAVNLVFAVTVPEGVQPRVTEADGTTDDVSWISLADVEHGRVPVTDVVRYAVGLTSAP
jgi:8-oxo-dGTP diphosphatase